MLDKKLREPVQLKKAFDVADMRRHLENLAFEDGKYFLPYNLIEEEIKKKSPRTQEQYGLKLMIKVSFLRDEMPPPTDLSFYKIGRLLGKGAFGKVNLALQKLSRRLVAIKSINKKFLKDEHSLRKIENEISLLRVMRHKSVVKLYETFETEKHYLFVMELCAGGDLLSYVRKRRKLNEVLAKYLFK
jgi:5'-AMP-activated protein kinase, catalytic alpha subunit